MKEQITNKEGICTLIFFIMGSTVVVGIGGDAKNNAWLAGIAGLLMSLPMIAVYARVQSLFPGKELFEILEMCLGKVIGKIISCIYIWYSFHLGALVLRNFSEFINTVTMPETPQFVIQLMVGLVCIYAAKLGIEVISRTSAYFLPVIVLVLLVIQLLGIREWDLSYFKPIMHHAIGDVLMGGFSSFSFPFTETVLFLGVMHTLKSRKAPYKVYYFSIFFAGFVIVTLTMRNTAVLGNLLSILYFPSYTAVGRISIGTFLQRMEVTVALVFLVSIFVKATVCLIVAAKGISRVCGLKDYRIVVIQLGLLMIAFSHFIYSNIMEMRYWAFRVYQYYAFPVEVILPLILLVVAEIRKKTLQAQQA